LSRTAVSEITARLWAEYEGFASRDLAEFEIVYLFVDGIAGRAGRGGRVGTVGDQVQVARRARVTAARPSLAP
jgi:hypothetical protein